MNIHSNVEKDNSKFVLFVGILIVLIIAAVAYYNTTTITTTVPMQTNEMSDADQIKQKIREAKALKDSYEVARDTAAQSRDFKKANDMLEKIAQQEAIIEKLYDDLHQANLKEGENGETK